MIILGIESSCDDTSAAIIKAPSSPSGLHRASFSILAEKTASQIEVHKKYGGVVPEIAGRKHAENILPVIEEVIKHSNIQTSKHPNIDAIAVTAGPGLITGLLVGVEAAKTLSYLWDIPLIGVNHIEGHIHSVELTKENNIEFPALCLIVSGGHTELVLMKDHGKYKLIGKTRDDAAGETFDKIAKLIGFEYPGGAKISKTAEGGNTKAIDFPRPMINDKSYDFSFSGLKTAALYWLRDNTKQKNIKNNSKPTTYELPATALNDFCASFEQAIVDVLVAKTIRAVKKYKPKTIILSGGVSANKKLRETLKEKNPGTELLLPELKYTMDNAAMIAVAGYYHALKKEFTNWKDIEACPNWTVYS